MIGINWDKSEDIDIGHAILSLFNSSGPMLCRMYLVVVQFLIELIFKSFSARVSLDISAIYSSQLIV